jgi:hypothetical protein
MTLLTNPSTVPTHHAPSPLVGGEPFVDAKQAAYTMNLPMYYLINAAQRDKLKLPYYRIGKLVRFKLSELADWQRRMHQAAVVTEDAHA